MAKNSNLTKAKKEKNDEFYTQYDDIENELKHYKDYFKDKIVYCNCDNPEWSNFWKYFELCFEHLGLKKLVSTHYEIDKPSYKLELEKIGGKLTKTKTPLLQNGDFRSSECIEILKECDIVVTNPPFSLFREYVAQLIEYDKKFLIIGNQNAITYKEIFPLIKENKIWISVSPRSMNFIRPDGSIENVNAVWYTNLGHKKRHEKVILYKEYKGNESEYPKYDNYDAINVDKSKDIPKDYDGIMGVPISFLTKLCPDQFEIVGLGKHPFILKLDELKIYENPKMNDKKSNTANAQLCLKLNDIKDIPEYTKYLNKQKYTADNAEGYLVAPYARLLIKRIDLDDKEFYGLD